MAYSRFSDSHLYVFATTLDGRNCIECMACPMGEKQEDSVFPKSFFAYSTIEMLNHLSEHIDNGDYFDHDIIVDIMEDDARNFGEDSDF